MAAPRLEDLFATFRATRDPRSLAAIFDATASELLLIAVHLVGDRAEAEDLVQSTFVAMIERADDYDASRPLMPWMVGVLANRAKVVIRRRGRAPSPVLGDAAGPGASTSPVDAAEAQEAAQHIARGLEGLPAHYRQVLLLHLVHGLGGVQIAQALGRPPATVRTQIKRALELLREVLPRALVVPVGLLAVEGRGLAAVRASVLEQATVGTGAVAASGAAASGATLVAATAGGILAMKHVILGVLALAVGVLLWLEIVPRPAPTPTLATVEEATGPTLSAPVASAVAVPSDQTEARRELLTQPVAPANVATVRGRLIAAWNDAPQTAHAIWVTATPQERGGGNSSKRLCEAPSGSDGRFELSFPFAQGVRHDIEIYGKEFVAVTGTIEVNGPGLLDLGDIRVLRGARIGARVVDDAGLPVPDVWFVIEYPVVTLGAISVAWTGIGTDAYGLLAMREDSRVHPGEVILEAPQGYEILASARFRVPDDADVAAPTIVVRKLGADRAIAGRVVDERGVGIANVRVLARSDDRGFTRAEGSFRVFRKPEDGDHLTMSFVGSDTKVGVAVLHAVWGAADLVVVQRDAHTLPLRVVASDTGTSVTRFKVHFGGSEDPMFQRSDLGKHWRLGPHADGRTDLAGLPATGRLSLIVAPDGDEYEMSPQLSFDLPRPPGEPLVVRLPPRRPVSVRVVATNGARVRGSIVRLVQMNHGEEMAENVFARSRDDAWDAMQLRSSKRWPTAFVVDTATTNADGEAQLRCALPATDLGILVTGASHRPFRASAIAFSDAPFEVVVEHGAGLRGRLRPSDLIARFSRSPAVPHATCVRLAVRRPGQPITRSPGARDTGYPIAADGRFAITGLDPGRWELVLQWDRPLQASTSTELLIETPVAAVDLEAGATRELGDLDVSQLAPATIQGVAFHRGTPVADGLVTLTLRRVDASGGEETESNLGGVRTDRDGHFSLGGLLAGTYTIHVEQIAADGTKLVVRSEDVVVGRGVSIERGFDLR